MTTTNAKPKLPQPSPAARTPKTAKLFKNGRSQAVRLPKEFRFEGAEVAIRRDPATGKSCFQRYLSRLQSLCGSGSISSIRWRFRKTYSNVRSICRPSGTFSK